MLNRKILRKNAREAKKQRKATHYQRKKLQEKQVKHQWWREQAKGKVQATDAKAQNPRKESFKRSSRSSLSTQSTPSCVTKTMESDILLDFAEKAVDEGILGSDGEFDEEKMNLLLAEHADSEDDSAGSPNDDDVYSVGEDDKVNDADMDSDHESAVTCSKGASIGGKAPEVTSDGLPLSSRRMTVEGPQEPVNPVQRKIQGLFNRLSSSNFQSIALNISSLLGQHSRHDVISAVCSCILTFVEKHANLLESFLVTVSALVSALTHLIGIDVIAKFLEECINVLDLHAGQEGASLKFNDAEEMPHVRARLNCVSLLSFLYDFQALSSSTIISIIDECTARLSEVDVEIVLRVLRICGSQLRLDDANELKSVFTKILSKAESKAEATRSSRFNFLLESIQDLKNNRRKLSAIQDGELATAKKLLRDLLLNNGKSKLDPLHITLADIRSSKTKGRWWLVGAAWNPDADSPMEDERSSPQKTESDSAAQFEDAIFAAARKHKMNTDTRRAIFSALMSSEDYLDAYHKLLSLRLPSKQEREIAHVLMYCSKREKAFNPFYALVACKFLETRHNFTITFRYIFWDRLEQYQGEDPVKLQHIVQDARFFALLVARRRFSLVALKRLSFGQLSQSATIFLKIMLSTVLESVSDDTTVTLIFCDVKDAASKVNGRKGVDELFDEEGPEHEAEDGASAALKSNELAILKTGLKFFLQRFMLEDGGTQSLSSQTIKRLEMAIRTLES